MPQLADRANEKWARLLARYDLPALIVGSGRKVLAANASFRSRFTGGEDPAGRFCFQLIHQSEPPCHGAGGRCPLEEADADGTSATPVVHRHLTCLGSAFDQVTARRVSGNGDQPKAFLLVTKPLAPTPNSWFLIGSSLALLRLLEKLASVAADDCAVLIRGEPGTGRACAGRLLHQLSTVAEGPFVPADCSAVEGSRLETVLFGNGGGHYAAARGGSLFLREPHLLPPSVQARIALLVESGVSSCRWLFAVDQAAASPRGALQGALGSARSILVPPLRDRIEDLPLLLETLVRRFGGAAAPTIDRDVPEVLSRYSFPGNLRELECLVERACLVSGGGSLKAEHFSPLDRA